MIASVSGVQLGELLERRPQVRRQPRGVKDLLGLQRRCHAIGLGQGRALAGMGQQVAGEQRRGRLVEPQRRLPVVRHVRGGDEAEPVPADVVHTVFRRNDRRPVAHVVQRHQAGQRAVDDLGVGSGGQHQVDGPALVGLDVAERDPPQLLQRHNAVDGLRHQWEQLPMPAVEQKRLVAGEQELVEREAMLGDVGDPGGQTEDVRPDLVDFGVHGSMMRRILHQGVVNRGGGAARRAQTADCTRLASAR